MSTRLITTLRWVARIGGLLVLLTVIVLAIGEGFPNPFTYAFTSSELLLTIALLTMLAGILVAWKWESIGGALLLVGYITATITEMPHRNFQLFSFFGYFLLLGLLNVGVWWSRRHTHATA
jgi:uncharacterized integral membrane protein